MRILIPLLALSAGCLPPLANPPPGTPASVIEQCAADASAHNLAEWGGGIGGGLGLAGLGVGLAVDNGHNGATVAAIVTPAAIVGAVEIALRNPAVKGAPILVLRGYPNGQWESSDEPGTPAALVKQAAQGVQYAATVPGAGQWLGEWRIPWASLGIDPAKHTKFEFNLTALKKAGDGEWVEWHGTGGGTWEVGGGGVLELVK